jgi:hypothetical protein
MNKVSPVNKYEYSVWLSAPLFPSVLSESVSEAKYSIKKEKLPFV